jgi:hypothetical protein
MISVAILTRRKLGSVSVEVICKNRLGTGSKLRKAFFYV